MIDNPYGFIYITTNKINGKRYIGQKKYDIASRWKSYLGSGYHLLASIRKHGKENFSRVIIDWAYSLEELNQKEYDTIEYFDAVASDDYYNMINGGDVGDSLSRRNSVPVVMISTRQVFDSILDGADYCKVGEGSIRLRMERSHTFKLMDEIPVFRKAEDINNIDNLCSICGKEFSNLLYRDSLQKLPRCEECDWITNMQENEALHRKRITKKELAKLGVEERKLCKVLSDERLEQSLEDGFLQCIDRGLSVKWAMEICDISAPQRIIRNVLSKKRPDWEPKMKYFVAFEDGTPIYTCQYHRDFLEWLKKNTEMSNITILDLNLLALYGSKIRGVEVKMVDSNSYYLYRSRVMANPQ